MAHILYVFRTDVLFIIGFWVTSPTAAKAFVYKVVWHADVIKWKYFPRYWSFVQKIHRLLVNPHPPPPKKKKKKKRTVMRSFDVFFDLRLNIRLSNQSWRRWFETPSRSLWPLWRHSNDFMKPLWHGNAHRYTRLLCEEFTCHTVVVPFIKDQSCGTLIFLLLFAWTSYITNSRGVGDATLSGPCFTIG